MALKKLLSILTAGVFLTASHVALGQEYTQEDIDSGIALADMNKKAVETALARLPDDGDGCTKKSVRRRKEWRNLPPEMRIKYTTVLQCLMKSPPTYTAEEAPGARPAFDDFAVLHYLQTPFSHNSATFLLWHRYYIWTLEEQLRGKCGYDDDFPYWGLDCDGPHLSPMLDGSETSMGSDGEPSTRRGGFGIGGGGTGGGCLMKGPFKNFAVNLGPVGSRNPLEYNPRCASRDLNGGVCARYVSLRNTTDAILTAPDIELFQATVQGDFRYPESRGLGMAVHGGGHFIIAGDPGGHFYFSPLEPAFYQHHSQIDRLYFIWQNLNWEKRQNIAGTGTMMNIPPSPEVQITESIDLSPLSLAAIIRDLIDTTGNTPFCFIYE